MHFVGVFLSCFFLLLFLLLSLPPRGGCGGAATVRAGGATAAGVEYTATARPCPAGYALRASVAAALGTGAELGTGRVGCAAQQRRRDYGTSPPLPAAAAAGSRWGAGEANAWCCDIGGAPYYPWGSPSV